MNDFMDSLGSDLEEKEQKQKKPVAVISSNERSSTTLVSTQSSCRQLIQEIYQFEGWQLPTCVNELPTTRKGAKDQMGDVVILDLTDSDDILSSVRLLDTRIPNNKAIVIIGTEDSIRTLRSMEQMGVVYLLWPLDKHELTDRLKQLFRPQNVSSIQYSRRAKRIAVIGVRGGVGTSNIAVEITALLARAASRSLLVDHHHNNSNTDIILNNKALSKFDINTMTVDLESLDAESANNYLATVADNFVYLGAVGLGKQSTLEKYTNSISQALMTKVNFIVEDYSASVDFPLDINQIIVDSHIVVLVLDPSVSSVRSSQILLDKINELEISSKDRIRVITVLNYHRPEGSFNFSQEEVERFINQKVNIQIPYYKQAMQCTLDGKRLHQLETRKDKPFSELFDLIHGKVTSDKKGMFYRLRGKRVR